MDRRACDHLAELVDQGVLAGKCQQGAVSEDEWPRHCRARPGGFPGDRATLHRRHPVGAPGAAAERLRESPAGQQQQFLGGQRPVRLRLDGGGQQRRQRAQRVQQRPPAAKQPAAAAGSAL
uniref:(northern house mosquito) hypothetical protein n=1 Tax=Culex pipiens TaxID=7175 RepID=A0A8D8FWB2_CULPI